MIFLVFPVFLPQFKYNYELYEISNIQDSS